MVYPIIMAGGTGTRFWPKSRSKFPKQFLSFQNGESLLAATARRMGLLAPTAQIFVVTNRKYLSRVREQLPDIPAQNILMEPYRRETAACIGYSALRISRLDPDGVLLIVPSDHHVSDDRAFRHVLEHAVAAATEGEWLVTVGITPTEPKTGFGYIHKGQPISSSPSPLYRVRAFTEKPSLDRAKAFLQSGEFLWNSGMFICRARVILDAIAKHLPALYQALKRIGEALGAPDEKQVVRREYKGLEKVSIDYGVMEKAANVVVTPAEFGWSDVGSWSVLNQMGPADELQNVVTGIHVGIDSHKNLIDSGKKLVATVGVENLIIVVTPDAVLVARKDRDQEVKELVKEIKARGLRQYF